MAPHILLLEAGQLTAYQRRGRHWVCTGCFKHGAADLARFATYLQQHRHTPCRLLADLAAEARVLDSIPRLHGADRQALIARKLAQHFPNSALRTALPLGPEKNRRDHEKLCLCAFTQADDFTPWLDRIAAHDIPLAGIHSITQLMGCVLAKLGQRATRCLFFQQNEAILREMFLCDGQVHFCRVIAAVPGKAGELAQDAGQLQHYLLKQQYIARGETLPAFLLGPDDSAASAPPPCQRLAPPAGRTPISLFLDALTDQPPTAQFASPGQRSAFQLARISRATTTGAALFLLGGLPIAASQIATTEELRRQTGQLQLDSAALQQRHDRQTAQLAAAPLPAASLRQITEGYGALIRQQRQPKDAYVKLSEALEQSPGIRLDSLDWQAEAGQASLLVHGQVVADGTPSAPDAQATFAHFVAVLRVDRGSTLHIRQGLRQGAPAARWRSDAPDLAAPAENDFTLEIRPKP